jgi:uncharacterized membrane protein
MAEARTVAAPHDAVGRAPRAWHGATFVVVTFALVLQLALVVSGASVLVEDALAPPLGTRILRYFSYFTVQSNILVMVTTAALVRRPLHDGRVWRTARLDAVAGITITGVVHWFFLRPLLDLQGWSWVADKLLHVAVPLLAVVGWLVFGPRLRTSWSLLLPALGWPVLWLSYTLAAGAITGWYPYPFLDVTAKGYGTVLVNSAGIAVALVVVLAALIALDPRLRRLGRVAP